MKWILVRCSIVVLAVLVAAFITPPAADAQQGTTAAAEAPAQEATVPALVFPSWDSPASSEAPQQPAVADPIKTRFGIGARAGGYNFGFGASIRYWFSDRVGFEFALSRTSAGAETVLFNEAGRSSADASVTQFSPALLIGFNKVEKDSVVFAPYVGGGVNIYRTSVSVSASFEDIEVGASDSDTGVGAAAFVGVDIRLRSVPSFGFGGDIGYYTTTSSFTGAITVGGFAIGFTGHYYFQ